MEPTHPTRPNPAAQHDPHVDWRRALVPFLVVEMVARLHHFQPLPSGLPEDELIEMALRQMEANGLDGWLVLSRGRVIPLYFGGGQPTTRRPSLPPIRNLCFGLLQPSVPIDPAEIAERMQLLAETKERLDERSRVMGLGGIIMGDTEKGGRVPDQLDLARLGGTQPDGVRSGLLRCRECGEYRGECLDEVLGRALVVVVRCRCEAWNRCAACGELLNERRLNANYYDERENLVWHVPGFSGLRHTCGE